jgi:DNA-binding transcriptional regulator YhcF (GntR family)
MTEADLLAAVAEYHSSGPLFEEGDGSLTAREMAAKLGASVDTAQRVIRTMLDEGRLEVGRRQVVKSDGYFQSVPAYKLRG